MNEESVKEMLKRVGVREYEIDKGQGTIDLPTHLKNESSRILSYEEFDTTPSTLSMRPNLVGKLRDRIISSRSAGVLSFRDKLSKACVQYRDPTIDFKIYPIQMKNLTWHAWSFYLQGDIVTKIDNKGAEGEKGITSVWFFEDCPLDSSQYEWGKVANSADLSLSWGHEIRESETKAILGKVNDDASPSVGNSTNATASWKSGNLADLIIQIINILLTGGVTTANGFDVSYSWNFNGTHTQTKHIDTKVWVPVVGSLTWIWN